MSVHLQRDIQDLKINLVSICTSVEENLTRAITSLENKNEKEAAKVVEVEKKIDSMEIEIEEECLKILALHQPVASDLRFVISALKINNDLERIGDMALHIVERFLSLDSQVANPKFPKLIQIAEEVRQMLRTSLDSLIYMDVNMAKTVWEQDKRVDAFHDDFFKEMKREIKDSPDYVNTWMNLLFISKQLERIGDHATNIAEDVIYLIEGNIVRHGGLEKK